VDGEEGLGRPPSQDAETPQQTSANPQRPVATTTPPDCGAREGGRQGETISGLSPDAPSGKSEIGRLRVIL